MACLGICCIESTQSSYSEDVTIFFVFNFYPTALKGCWVIIFTHGVRMGRRTGKVCPGCISETVGCGKLILGRDIG